MTALDRNTRDVLPGGITGLLRRRGLLIMGVVVAMAAGAVLKTRMQTSVYRSTAQFSVQASTLDSPLVDTYAMRVDPAAELDLLAKSEHAPDLLAATHKLLKPTTREVLTKPEDLVPCLKLDVNAQNVVGVEARASTPDMAMDLSMAYLQACTDQINRPRIEAAVAVKDFISNELDQSRTSLTGAQVELDQYRSGHGQVLPELEAITYNLLLSLEAEQVQLDAKRHAIEQERTMLEAEPEVSSGSVPGLQEQIRQAGRSVTAAEARLTANHPDLLRMRARLSHLRADLEMREQGLTPPTDTGARSPAMEQYRSVIIEQQALERRFEQVSQRVLELQTQINAAGSHDAEFMRLTRNVESMSEVYLDLVRRRERAATSEHLVRVNHGDVVRVLRTPVRPDHAETPGLKTNLLLSLVGGLVAGLALAAMAELTDRRVRGPRDLAGALGAPTLAMMNWDAPEGN